MKPNKQQRPYGKKRPQVALDPTQDGVTHINVYSKGKTLLGKFLSNMQPYEFTHPAYGKFSSIEGFWHWLSTGKVNEKFRTLHGFEALSLGRSLLRVPMEGFEEEIKVAIRAKIDNHPMLKLLLIQNKLPLTHYFVFADKDKKDAVVIRDQPQFRWQTLFIEQLATEYRAAIIK